MALIIFHTVPPIFYSLKSFPGNELEDAIATPTSPEDLSRIPLPFFKIPFHRVHDTLHHFFSVQLFVRCWMTVMKAAAWLHLCLSVSLRTVALMMNLRTLCTFWDRNSEQSKIHVCVCVYPAAMYHWVSVLFDHVSPALHRLWSPAEHMRRYEAIKPPVSRQRPPLGGQTAP